ncbi:glutathione S-transferase C-terminal-like protein [Laetiporus sulphureus 93-53]|uniref:Glutathione S-transferase C-terminal-like protein n=1 Tax=Laetiporus sulphureus 93-53 TaxID=1314785 RepID=A0A165BZA2_9APHY|nr:glutathione S-transferase C-terminal-like protein [Laetiporus sulphureus 93-53]KZT01922.1 glutathione S-transferase C-terminal-like protein [Laetiporus sulphureus 93-53]
MLPKTQFTLYTYKGGLYGWKVAMVMTELGLTYESIYLDFDKREIKAPAYTKYNPNGRIPTVIDHKSNNFVIRESDAIIAYFVEKNDTAQYDTAQRISAVTPEVQDPPASMALLTGLWSGPYFGQAIWIKVYHPEKVPSAVQRYQKEALRVIGVLESVLQKQEWLVGGKCSVADMAFITWNNGSLGMCLNDVEGLELENDYPAFHAWPQKLMARPAIKSVWKLRASLQG